MKSIACLLLATTSALECGNGNFCADQQTCVTSKIGAGLKFGCAPTASAAVCKDTRFSCPSTFACLPETATGIMCTNGQRAQLNVQAKTLKQANDDICSILAPDLPSFCTCAGKGPYGGLVDCEVNMLDVDTVGMQMDVEPCVDPAKISLVVTEADLGINYTIADIEAGTTEVVPIPGLSIPIPLVGDAQVQADITVDGDASMFTIDIGLDACVTVFGFTKCGSDLTSDLPIDVLNTTVSFSGVCSR